MTLLPVRIDRHPADDRREVWSESAVESRRMPKHKRSAARAAFQEALSQLERHETSRHAVPSPEVPSSDNSPVVSPTPTGEPPVSALLWAVVVCGALRPFVWLVRCRCCWHGRCRTVIGQHESHLRVLKVCPTCDAARPIPAWLQPPQSH
jgi:hypothetical protein